MKRTIKHKGSNKSATVEVNRGFTRTLSATLAHMAKQKEIVVTEGAIIVEGVDSFLSPSEVKAGGWETEGTVSDKDTMAGKDAATMFADLFGVEVVAKPAKPAKV